MHGNVSLFSYNTYRGRGGEREKEGERKRESARARKGGGGALQLPARLSARDDSNDAGSSVGWLHTHRRVCSRFNPITAK